MHTCTRRKGKSNLLLPCRIQAFSIEAQNARKVPLFKTWSLPYKLTLFGDRITLGPGFMEYWQKAFVGDCQGNDEDLEGGLLIGWWRGWMIRGV